MSSSSIKKVRGLRIFDKKHKAVKTIIKKGHYPKIHGDKVWFSSYFIMDYLRKHTSHAKRANIMEVGCGWGLLSIFCAKKFKANVVSVDADKHVMPLLQLHSKENNVSIATKVCRYEHLKPKTLAKQDIIVGGDICFWDELVAPLYSMIKRALKQNVGTIIIADPGRSPFLKLAKRCQKQYDAELIPVSIKKPNKEQGYLLVINAQAA